MSIVYRLIWYWLPVVLLCSAIFIQSSFPSPDTLPSFPFSDKLMHMVVYGLLAALVCRATHSHGQRQHWRWRLFFIAVAAASLYGLSDEWHQSFVSGRSAEAADLMADVLGSIMGSGAFLWYLQRGRSNANRKNAL